MEKAVADPHLTSNLPLQHAQNGEGPLYHRAYKLEFNSNAASQKSIFVTLSTNLDRSSSSFLARFFKTRGSPFELKLGHEYMIRINGPWDGPVRVTELTENSFTFQTLEGHLEAGKIKFSIHEKSPGCFYLLIESLARSRDQFISFFYDKVPLVRFAQTQMWTRFCKNFVKDVLKDAKICSKVTIQTEKKDSFDDHWIEV